MTILVLRKTPERRLARAREAGARLGFLEHQEIYSLVKRKVQHTIKAYHSQCPFYNPVQRRSQYLEFTYYGNLRKSHRPTTMTAHPPTLQQLTAALVTAGLPTPSPHFLTAILTPSAASQRIPPLKSLVATARARLLSADITTSDVLSPSTPAFPPRISDVKIASKTLSNDIPVQVIDIEDLSKSKWEQIEALEAERKGEMTRGREIIRVVAAVDEDAASLQGTAQTQQHSKSHGPFKLLMQDVKGQKIFGFELKKVEVIGMPGGDGGMSIGAKVLLKKGSKVARGMVLLEPSHTTVLGGKIDGLDKVWREDREQALRDAVGAVGAGRRDGDRAQNVS